MTRAEIETFLPLIFQRAALPGTPLAALLEAMESLHERPEAVLRSLDAVFDPRRTPARFVPMLARWLDLDHLLEQRGAGGAAGSASWDALMTSGLGRLRELVAAAAYLAKWRGTGKGLRMFLETATGVEGFVLDEKATGADGRIVPFHVLVRAPLAAEVHGGLIRRVVDAEKPAYVTYDLVFG